MKCFGLFVSLISVFLFLLPLESKVTPINITICHNFTIWNNYPVYVFGSFSNIRKYTRITSENMRNYFYSFANKYDVYGIEIGIPFNYNLHTVYGFQGGFTNGSIKIYGIQAGFLNHSDSGFLGQFGVINGSRASGLQFGWINFNIDSFSGIQYGPGNFTRQGKVFQFGILNGAENISTVRIGVLNLGSDIKGLEFGFLNYKHKTFDGLQVGLLNDVINCSGIQIGLLNCTQVLKGIQIGLLNIIKTSKLPVMIGLNASI